MSIRKQSPYGPFVQRVLLPTLRIGTILAALLAICFGSWLETNESFESCSFKSSMALHQVFLFRNITSNLTTPDSVSFGLWKHCYIYALNCSCTPTNLKYQPDISTILQVATEHNAIAPLSNGTSLSRIVPLSLALSFSCIALLLGLWANRPKKYIYRRITAGFILATMVLVAYGFLSAYDQYFQKIKETCRNPNNNVLCARHAVQIEVVIFGMALALLFMSFMLWVALSFFNNNQSEEEYIGQMYKEEEWNCSSDSKITPSKRTADPTSSPSSSSHDYYPTDEMVVWRDVNLFKEEDPGWEKQKSKGEQDQIQEKSSRHARGNCMTRGAATNYPSIGPNEKPSLPPPPTPNSKPIMHSVKPPRTTAATTTTTGAKKLGKSKNSLKEQRSSYSSRKASHDSVHTFGGSKSPRRRSQGSPLTEFPEERGNKTPTTMSPHPFPPSPVDQKNPQSLYSLDNNSSGNSNSSGYFGSKSGNVPILNMPPTGLIEHPLNKKIITDKRIQSYLQSKE